MDRWKRFYLLSAFLLLCGSVIAGQNARAQVQGPQQQDSIEAGERAAFGTVLDQREIQLRDQEGARHLIKLQNSEGRVMVVDLGVQGALELNNGDQVFVQGRSALINDRPVLYAESAGKVMPVPR